MDLNKTIQSPPTGLKNCDHDDCLPGYLCQEKYGTYQHPKYPDTISFIAQDINNNGSHAMTFLKYRLERMNKIKEDNHEDDVIDMTDDDDDDVWDVDKVENITLRLDEQK